VILPTTTAAAAAAVGTGVASSPEFDPPTHGVAGTMCLDTAAIG